MIKRNVISALCILLAGAAVLLSKDWWDKKPFQEWTEKDAARMLNNSPWGQIHTVTIINNQYSGDTRTFQSIGSGDLEREKRNRFHLRFITAKPIRMAIARQMMATRKTLAPELMQKYVDQPNEQNIVVAMVLSSEPPGASSLNGYISALMKLRTTDLTHNTSLTTNSGGKVFLVRYDPPGRDSLGAKFYFPRNKEDGTPLVSPGDKELRFETSITLLEDAQPAFQTGSASQRTDPVWMQFDLKKMIFEGRLEI
jgi:hypothetical protein